MSKILKKLTSRKLWVAIAGIATGIAIAFGVDAGQISVISGAVTAVVSAVSYIIAEAKIDKAAVKLAAEAATAVQDAVNTIKSVGEPGNTSGVK